jgi:hypothetical protein
MRWLVAELNELYWIEHIELLLAWGLLQMGGVCQFNMLNFAEWH